MHMSSAKARSHPSWPLQVLEAMLTGESVPSSKGAGKAVAPDAPLGDRKCMAYSATNVVAGQAEGIVVGTGDSAEIGQISKMVNTVSCDLRSGIWPGRQRMLGCGWPLRDGIWLAPAPRHDRQC